MKCNRAKTEGWSVKSALNPLFSHQTHSRNVFSPCRDPLTLLIWDRKWGIARAEWHGSWQVHTTYMFIPFILSRAMRPVQCLRKIEAQRGWGTSISEKSAIRLTWSHQPRFVMEVKTTTIFPIKGLPASISSRHLENTCMCVLPYTYVGTNHLHI